MLPCGRIPEVGREVPHVCYAMLPYLLETHLRDCFESLIGGGGGGQEGRELANMRLPR